MTAAQSLKIFEILSLQYKPEDARAVVEAIEKVVDEKVVSQTEAFNKIITKDIENLRLEMYKVFATKEDIARLEAKIAESKADTLKWMVALFAPFYVGMIVFLVRHSL